MSFLLMVLQSARSLTTKISWLYACSHSLSVNVHCTSEYVGMTTRTLGVRDMMSMLDSGLPHKYENKVQGYFKGKI